MVSDMSAGAFSSVVVLGYIVFISTLSSADGKGVYKISFSDNDLVLNSRSP